MSLADHQRALVDQLYGAHDESDPDCWGTHCDACGCCLHCEHECHCAQCGCRDYS